MDPRDSIRFSYPHIFWTDHAREAIKDAIDSGWISISQNVERLEKTCAEIFEVEFVIACSSATQGLAISARAAGWRDMKVGLPAFTWPSTLYALEANNCQPVYADIDPRTWLMDPATLAEPVDAYMPVDVFGNQWLAAADDRTPVIVDAAHGFGLPQLGRRGLFEVVSLSHTKIPTAGEGGLILTRDRGLAEEATELRRLAARMNEFCAIVGLESISQYGEMVARRAEIMDQYDGELKIAHKRQEILTASSNSVYALRIEDASLRQRLGRKLAENRVEYKIYYDPLCQGLPETDRLYEQVFCLPVYPRIKEHLPFIIGLVNSCI